MRNHVRQLEAIRRREETALAKLAEVRAERDRRILDAIEGGMTERTAAALVGLSRGAIYKLRRRDPNG